MMAISLAEESTDCSSKSLPAVDLNSTSSHLNHTSSNIGTNEIESCSSNKDLQVVDLPYFQYYSCDSSSFFGDSYINQHYSFLENETFKSEVEERQINSWNIEEYFTV